MVTCDKTWLVVNRRECESPMSTAMELVNLRRDCGKKRISVLGNYFQKIITPVKYVSDIYIYNDVLILIFFT
jgi:hypothetical protein